MSKPATDGDVGFAVFIIVMMMVVYFCIDAIASGNEHEEEMRAIEALQTQVAEANNE